jgi:hypothetical protein
MHYEQNSKFTVTAVAILIFVRVFSAEALDLCYAGSKNPAQDKRFAKLHGNIELSQDHGDYVLRKAEW